VVEDILSAGGRGSKSLWRASPPAAPKHAETRLYFLKSGGCLAIKSCPFLSANRGHSERS